MRKTRKYTDCAAIRAGIHNLIALGWTQVGTRWISPYFGSAMTIEDANQLESEIVRLGLTRIPTQHASGAMVRS